MTDTPTRPAFLNVSASATGRRWIGPSAKDDRQAEALEQATGLPPALCRVLARRGVPAQEAELFLAPALRDLLPDPRSLRDMDKAAARFLEAVEKRQRIAIFADYDVDGGSSGALLICWLRDMGLPATLYIPDRIDEGYGPNDAAMSALARDHDLIICVDCGTLSHGPIAAAAGADVLVLDHHLGGETLPPALAVVNPNRQDETGDLAHLCAAGVVFLMLVEAGRLLREAGRKGPDLMSLLDLGRAGDRGRCGAPDRGEPRLGASGADRDGAPQPPRSGGAGRCGAHGHRADALSPWVLVGPADERRWPDRSGRPGRAVAVDRRPA